MNNKRIYASLLQIFLLVAGFPLVVIVSGDFVSRTLLKDSLSLMTILSFSLLIGQFFWCGMNRNLLGGGQARTLVRFHNAVGYMVCLTFFFHPLFLVLPRFFEKGMEPSQAFLTIVTTFSSRGVVLGLVSWGILVVLAVTSFFRKKLPVRYATWRTFHGLFSSLFLISATWHVVVLGRHGSSFVSTLFITYSSIALLLYLKSYFTQTIPYSGKKEWLIQA